MRLVVVVVLLLLVGGLLLQRSDPALLNRILTVSGQVGPEKKSPQWVQDWITAHWITANNKQANVRCTDGINGWDYQCTYFDTKMGGMYHFGAYVYNPPSGPVVIESGLYPINLPIRQRN